MKNEKMETLLYNITCTYNMSEDKHNLFTPKHTKYICEIANEKGNYIFTYQCNTQYTRPTKNSLIACCLSDASCYEGCLVGDDIDNLEEFKNCFGYDDNIKELLNAYKGCKEAYNAINKMLTKEEQEELYNYFVEIGEI